MQKTVLIIIQFVILSLLTPIISFAAKFQCEKVFSPDLQVNQVKMCNSSYVGNSPSLYRTNKVNFDNHLYYTVLNKNNLGGIKVLFPNHQEKIVYRSAYLAGAPLCIQSLSKNGVDTVINLYSSETGYALQLTQLEKSIFTANNIQNYIQISGYMVDRPNLVQNELNAKIVTVIDKIASAKGNVLIHCYTGEHDTGVIFGILNKCYNHQTLENIKQDTLCHMGDNSNYQRKTFEHAMQLIEQFPCKLLSR